MRFITSTQARVLAVVAAIALVVAASPVAGAHHKYGHQPSPSEPTIEVVVSGLDSPRGLNFGYTGILYIAEAGRGGDGPCVPGPEGGEVCLGQTGKITGHWRGDTWTVADGLPSSADEQQSDVTGPHDVAVSPLGLIVPVGLGADPAVRDGVGPAGEHFGTVLRVNPSSGEWSPIADLAEYEAINDPDAGQPGVEHPDSNPFGVDVHGTTVTVTDAGANAVLQFRQRLTGDPTIETLAVLPFRLVEAPPFPDLPPEIPMQPVPTTVARQGGTYFVGQLTGFPFPVGGANVYQVRKGQEPEVYASGFTNIIDIAVDKKGGLLVLEMFTNGLFAAEDDPSGALWRVDRDGTKTLIADGGDGLLAPAGIAVGRDGSYYVTNKAVFGEGQGEVLRITR
jgi:hypothetical protein